MANVQCHRCGYVWEYTGSLRRATCPNCATKVPVEENRLGASLDQLADDYDMTVEEVKELLERARSDDL
ncbi:hypothetical protein [Halorussus sp. AFM4]|uniref:hypothetical protein n=1 Tax=Halorussus sp. AFM4 TaxID=3421651 RepID=UPI003EC0B505